MVKVKTRKRTNPQVMEKVRMLISQGSSVADIVKALKVNPTVVYNQRTSMKKKPKSITKKTKLVEIKSLGRPSKSSVANIASLRPDLAFRVPDAGLVLKMTNSRHILGTLVVTPTGLRYSPSNAKKHAPRELPWNALHSLLTSGLLG